MSKSIIWLGVGLVFFGAFLIFLVNELQSPAPVMVEVYQPLDPLPEVLSYYIPDIRAARAMEISQSVDTVYIDVHRIDTVYVHKVDTVYVSRIDLDRIFDGLDRIFGSIEMLLSLMASGLAFYKFWDSRKTKE